MNLPLSPKQTRTRPTPLGRSICTRIIVDFAAVAMTMLSLAGLAKAASGTWAGTTDGLWSSANGTNWSVTPPPGATSGTTNIDTATFNSDGNGNTTITIDAGRNIKSILFDTATADYIIGSAGPNGGNALTLTSGGSITLASTVAGTNVIETLNAPLVLAGNYTFTNAFADAGSALVFAGNITNTATSTLTISGAGTGTGNLISGSISDGGGVQSVTFSATNGTWTLSGANSYSGTTSITGANSTVVMSGSNSSAGATTLNNATATLQLDSDSNGGLPSGLLTLTAGKLEALGADRAISNAVSVAAVTVQGTHTLTFNGKLTGLSGGNRVITNNIASGSTLTLGDVDINSETANARTLTFTGSGDTVINGVVANGNALKANGLIMLGTGTLTLNSASTYTGTTTIGASSSSATGTLTLSGAGTLGSGVLNIVCGTLDVEASSVTLANTITLGGGSGTSAAVVIGPTSTLTLGGNLTFSSSNGPLGATISGGTLNLGIPRAFNIGDSTATSDLTISSRIGDGNSVFDINKTGAGTLEYTPDIDLTTLTTLTPTVTVTTGTLQLDGAITGGDGIFGVNKTGSGTLNYARNLVLTENETATVTGGTLQFSGVISGAFGFTAANSTGLISLTAANTYTGDTILNGGGQLSLSGPAGSVAFSDVRVTGGSVLNLDSSAAGLTGTTRAQNVSLFGNSLASSLTVTGNAGSSSIDRIANALTAAAGMSIVTLQPDPAQNTQLQTNSFVRNPGAAILFRGTNLGVNSIASATANSSNIVFTTAPTLSGGGGAAGSTTVSILPGAIGDTSATGAGNGTATGGLVTYDPAKGIRVLDPVTEYKASIDDGQTQLDNVRLAHTSGSGVLTRTLSIDTTINSLSFNITGTGTDAGITLDGAAGVTLTVASGVIYTSSSASSATGNAQTISVPTLSLNGHEGNFIAFTPMPSTGTISTFGLLNITSAITNDGGNGVTVSGLGTQGVNGGEVQFSGSTANTYTGTTTVNGIVLKLAKTVANAAIPGDLVLNAGAIYDGTNQIADTSNVTINGGTFYQNGSNNSGSSTSETIGSLTLNGGTISPGQGSGNTLTILGTMTLNGSSFTTSTGGKLNVGGLATFAGGRLTLGISNSPSTYANVATFSGGIAIVNPASGAYTPITINAGSANLGGKLLLSGDLTFTGNATNANTATINGAAGTSPGIFALDGTRTFNVGDGAAAVDLAITAPLSDNGATAGGLIKTGSGTLKLTAGNTYTGPTTVRGGTLEVSGSLNGSTMSPVNVQDGTLILSAGNVISSPTSDLVLGDNVNLTHGTLKLNDSLSSVSETFGNLSVDFGSTIDFGALNGNSLIFAGVGAHTSGATLSITNWTGTALQAGGASDDRLLFVGSDPSAFTSAYGQADVSFNGIGGYTAIQVDANHFEIVAIPEPTPVALQLSLGIVGLIGLRRGRRHS